MSESAKGKTVLVLLCDSNEEAEAVCTIDVLRTAGIEVYVAGVSGRESVLCKNKLRIVPDVYYKNIADLLFDAVVIPGGPGADDLAGDATVTQILKNHIAANKLICAICLGPIVLLKNKLLFDRAITTHPQYSSLFFDRYKYKNRRVVVDGNLITSQAPGTAIEFALAIVQCLTDEKTALKVGEHLRVAVINED